MLEIIQLQKWKDKTPDELIAHLEALWKDRPTTMVLLLNGEKVIGSAISPEFANSIFMDRIRGK